MAVTLWQLHLGRLQGVDGTIELQSAGLPLPDHPLRWLNPLARPLLQADPTGGSRLLSLAADAVMQDTPSPVLAHPTQALPLAQEVPQPIKQEVPSQPIKQGVPSQQGPQQPQTSNGQQANASQTNMQEQAQRAASGGVPSGPSPMQVDSPQHAQTTSPSLQNGSNDSQGAQPTSQQQPLAQAVPPLQMISVPEGLQELVNASVARCDRQLLGRQEQVLVRLVQQRVAEEVRLVQGAQDMDHPADDLVQRVSMLALACVYVLNTYVQKHTCSGWEEGEGRGRCWCVRELPTQEGSRCRLWVQSSDMQHTIFANRQT